jgi:type III secretion protein V
VLEALAEWGNREKETASLTELVRIGLKRYMTSRFADAHHRVKALVLDGAVEDVLRRSISQTPAGPLLMLPPERLAELRANLLTELERLAAAGASESDLVVTTAVDVRRYVRQVVEPVRPELQVLSYQELLPSVEVQSLGTLRFGKERS